MWVEGISGSTGQITLNVRIDNMTSQSVDLSTVTLRYWYKDEGLGTALKVSNYYVSIGHSNAGSVVFERSWQFRQLPQALTTILSFHSSER